ncbi:hypothetical protein [Parendozoicomonas haliclonae]|uniref:IgA FC receptor n=1 Tax=Parendozoicomonas haliclonae TaxID=1960125 RepID=A0A1X7AMG9_9GAMM|nr:hypothetical protein [Parendozoicomonas haliclonae]SMA49105.1 IgA FC receptor precursor [Parendozoicomonas haliclonae]
MHKPQRSKPLLFFSALVLKFTPLGLVVCGYADTTYNTGTYTQPIQASQDSVTLQGNITVNFSDTTPGQPAVVAENNGTITGDVQALTINLDSSFAMGIVGQSGGQVNLSGPLTITTSNGLSQNYGVVSYTTPGLVFNGPVNINLSGQYTHGALAASGSIDFNQPLTINHNGTGSYGLHLDEQESSGQAQALVHLNAATTLATQGEGSASVYVNGGQLVVQAPLTATNSNGYSVFMPPASTLSSLSTRQPASPNTPSPQVIRLQGLMTLSGMQNQVTLDLAAGSDINGPVNITSGKSQLYFYSPTAKWQLNSGSMLTNAGSLSLNFVDGGTWQVPLSSSNETSAGGVAPLLIINGSKLSVTGKGTVLGDLQITPSQEQSQQFRLIKIETDQGGQLDINLADLTPTVSNPDYSMTLAQLADGGNDYLVANLTYTPQETPLTPATPITPETPLTPATPITPETPLTPAAPITPEVPLTPATPITPEVPLTPATPIAPETPLTPATPITPETPLSPSTPVTPETPLVPAAPVMPFLPTANTSSRPPSYYQPVPASWLDHQLAIQLLPPPLDMGPCNEVMNSLWVGLCPDPSNAQSSFWVLPLYDQVYGKNFPSSNQLVDVRGHRQGLGIQWVQGLSEGQLFFGLFGGSGRLHSHNALYSSHDKSETQALFAGGSHFIGVTRVDVEAVFMHTRHHLQQQFDQTLLESVFPVTVGGLNVGLSQAFTLFADRHSGWTVIPTLALNYWQITQSGSHVKVNGQNSFNSTSSRQSIWKIPIGVELRGDNLLKSSRTVLAPSLGMQVSTVWGQRKRKSYFYNAESPGRIAVLEPEIDSHSQAGQVGFKLSHGALEGSVQYGVTRSHHLQSRQISADLVWLF